MIDKNNEVLFGEYCKTCKYKNYAETDSPCAECLAEPVNLYSHKPVNWVGADGIFSGPPPRPDHAYRRAVKYVPENRKDKEKAIARQNIDAEYAGNKVQSIDGEVTDDQYPSATAVKKALETANERNAEALALKIDAPTGCECGEFLAVEEVDENGVATKVKTQKVETAPPDWTENDSTKPGYIKNKPFYTELENQTYDKVVDMSVNKYVDVGVSDFTLFEGTKYTVTWDGKKYESTCESDYGILHIGNFALYDITPFSKTDTGEPFCVIYDGNTNQNQIIGEQSGASHHIVMLYGIPTVHMLSPAYIGVRSKLDYMSDDSGRVKYLAAPDGNYELVVPEIPNIKEELYALKDKRIATFEMTAEQLDAVSSNEYTEIKTDENIAVSGYNHNDLRSYYVVIWVGDKRYTALPMNDNTNAANFIFETEQFELPVRTYCIRIKNGSYKQKIIRLDQNALNEEKFIFKQQAVSDAGKVLTVGEDGKVVAGSGGSDLSLGLTSAQVGQIIKVKAVDDAGKPTQWEAGEMGGDGVKEIFSVKTEEDATVISQTLTENDIKKLISAAFVFVTTTVPRNTDSSETTNGKITLNILGLSFGGVGAIIPPNETYNKSYEKHWDIFNAFAEETTAYRYYGKKNNANPDMSGGGDYKNFTQIASSIKDKYKTTNNKTVSITGTMTLPAGTVFKLGYI